MIKMLIKECKKNGTLPFAHFARIAFISISIFKDGVKNHLISQKAFDEFLNSLNTVSKTMSNEANLCRKKKINKKDFIDKYSHLRPGTYDILSSNYSDNNNKILRDILKNNKIYDHHNNNYWKKEKKYFLKYINSRKVFNLKTEYDIEKFLKVSIEYRELSKFYFTKYVNKILELIKEISKEKNLNINDIAFLKLKDFFKVTKKKNELKKKINSNKLIFNINKNYELPHLIRNGEDFLQFQHLKSVPNFVGNFTISSNILLIDKNFSEAQSLKNKIIMIESADPGYDWIFGKKISGLITMFGGANSHMAIRASELNLPAAIGVGKLKFGQLVNSSFIKLDPTNRKVEVIE